MKIVIVGAGRVGYAIAEQLLTEGHDITVVEGDPEGGVEVGEVGDGGCPAHGDWLLEERGATQRGAARFGNVAQNPSRQLC